MGLVFCMCCTILSCLEIVRLGSKYFVELASFFGEKFNEHYKLCHILPKILDCRHNFSLKWTYSFYLKRSAKYVMIETVLSEIMNVDGPFK